jgi:hypothetical protein
MVSGFGFQRFGFADGFKKEGASMTDDKTAGIPTLFENTRFRSRLEARWAAFFKLLGWDAHYEPFDLDGYIPDFVINGREHCDPRQSASKIVPILVEVKPVADMNDPLFLETVRKIEASGWDREALIVSYMLPAGEYDHLSVGWLCQEFEDFWGDAYPAPRSIGDMGSWGPAHFQTVGHGCKAVAGFCHGVHSYYDRISGYYPGGVTGADNEDLIRELWARAGNMVQWQGATA